MKSETKMIPVTVALQGECCHQTCPQLRMRDAGRGDAWRCKWLDCKLEKCFMPNQPAFRAFQCIEVFGDGEEAS